MQVNSYKRILMQWSAGCCHLPELHCNAASRGRQISKRAQELGCNTPTHLLQALGWHCNSATGPATAPHLGQMPQVLLLHFHVGSRCSLNVVSLLLLLLLLLVAAA